MCSRRWLSPRRYQAPAPHEEQGGLTPRETGAFDRSGVKRQSGAGFSLISHNVYYVKLKDDGQYITIAVRAAPELWACSSPCWATLLDLPQPVVAVLTLQAAAGSHVARHCDPMCSVDVFESVTRVLQQMVEMALHSDRPRRGMVDRAEQSGSGNARRSVCVCMRNDRIGVPAWRINGMRVIAPFLCGNGA